MQVDMPPTHHGPLLHSHQYGLPAVRIRLLPDFLGEIQVIPADDRVLAQTPTALGQLLLVDGNHLCDLGHTSQTVWFYRDLAVTTQPKQRLNIRCLIDSVNVYCQAISHRVAIDFRALIGPLSDLTLLVRKASGPFRTIGCRAPGAPAGERIAGAAGWRDTTLGPVTADARRHDVREPAGLGWGFSGQGHLDAAILRTSPSRGVRGDGLRLAHPPRRDHVRLH